MKLDDFLDFYKIYINNQKSEFTMARVSRERNHIPNILNSGHEHNQTFKAGTETRMGTGTVFSQLQIPPVVFRDQIALTHALH